MISSSSNLNPFLVAFLVSSFVGLSVCDSAFAAEAQPPTNPSSVDKIVEVPSAAADLETEKVLNSLAAQAGWFPDVKITVKSGMVTIVGKAKNQDQLAWLAKTADRLPSVVAVINKASVEKPAVTDLSPAWAELREMIERAKRALPLFGIAFALFTIFYFVGKYLMRGVTALWSRKIDNPFLLATVVKVTMVPIWVVFFYLTLQTAGLSSLATTIIGGTGALGIVLGFAFKDIMGNYLSGLLLAFRSPFTKGDWIKVDGYEGFVQSINMRGTTILDFDGNFVLIPNSNVIQSVIKNMSANPEMRYKFTVGIGYADSYQKANELIIGVLNEMPEVLKKPAPVAVLDALSASSADIIVYFWIDMKKSSGMRVKADVINRVKEALLAGGITLPDSSREIVFTDTLKIQNLEPHETFEDLTSEKQEKQKRRASENLGEAKKNAPPCDTSQEEEIKSLGGGVDLLNASTQNAHTLYKEPEAAPKPRQSVDEANRSGV